jgi:hypothetical protein
MTSRGRNQKIAPVSRSAAIGLASDAADALNRASQTYGHATAGLLLSALLVSIVYDPIFCALLSIPDCVRSARRPQPWPRC